MSSHWERHSPSDDDDLSSIHTYSTSSTNATLWTISPAQARLAFPDSSDVDDLASTFMDAFIRMQERGFNFTPQSLEPLELALLLTRMTKGTSLWPCSVGPVALGDIGKVDGLVQSQAASLIF